MPIREGITPRKYQTEIAESALRGGNTLVVLPTGLGKTLIAVLVIERMAGEGAALFLAPTKPLVQQHLVTIKDMVPGVDAISITGEVPKVKRSSEWGCHDVIIATPQTVEKDLGMIDKRRFSLVVLDEVHRAIGKYAYAEIAREFRPHSKILGLTASPGGKKAKIDEITETLGISNVESRDHMDDDVKPYVKEMDVEWVPVQEREEYAVAKQRLHLLTGWYLDMVKRYGFRVYGRSRKMMIAARGAILKSRLKTKYNAIKYLSAAINLDYATEMLEVQSMGAFFNYIENLKARESKGVQLLLKDGRLQEIIEWVGRNKVIHPKMEKLMEIIGMDMDAKYIVFSQYTAQIEYLEKTLGIFGFKCKKFTGQRKGFTRKKQLEIIERFRNGEFNVLIASSVGEEGLDIPSVDYVIFYEPIPSEIRSIQRRGRTGRAKKGFVKVLIAKGTRDEAYLYSSKSKERKMRKIITGMKNGVVGGLTGTLRDFM